MVMALGGLLTSFSTVVDVIVEIGVGTFLILQQ